MPDAAIALNRFGLGARPGDSPPADPRRFLIDQLGRYEARPAPIAAVPARREIVARLAAYFEELRGQGARPPRAAPAMPPVMPAAEPGDGMAELPEPVRRFIQGSVRDHYLAMVAARTQAALATPAPFAERLVHFWANHFAVSADKLTVIGLAGQLEFEAVRPHLTGRFSQMLAAVECHPAMLLYLDQAQSVGPGSRAGRLAAAFTRRRPGLNENLAREILELHTLGVDGGYGQADVTELARALTGWTVSGLARGRGARLIGATGAPGDFHFAAAIHEPGGRTILGRRYDQEGERQAQAVLDDLAAHPATARHVSTKLARHFAGDDPPPAMVERLTQAWLGSGGDLPTVYRAIVDSPEAWARGPVKFRTPWEWSLAALRGVGMERLEPRVAGALFAQLGQPVWRPGSPAGYDDVAASWAGPDALMRRVEAAERIAARAGAFVDARSLAPRLLAGALRPETARAIERAESPAQGLALLLVAPEFLRR